MPAKFQGSRHQTTDRRMMIKQSILEGRPELLYIYNSLYIYSFLVGEMYVHCCGEGDGHDTTPFSWSVTIIFGCIVKLTPKELVLITMSLFLLQMAGLAHSLQSTHESTNPPIQWKIILFKDILHFHGYSWCTPFSMSLPSTGCWFRV